jgi:hypothetical protein
MEPEAPPHRHRSRGVVRGDKSFPARVIVLWQENIRGTINVLLCGMKPRKHIHVKYCRQTYFKFIGTLSINLIGQWVKIRTRDHTGQKSYSTPSEASKVFPPELSFFDRKTSEALGTHHLLWMWFYNVWDNVPMDLKYVCQQINLFMVINIWGIIIYIYCMLVALREYDTLGWIIFYISWTRML